MKVYIVDTNLPFASWFTDNNILNNAEYLNDKVAYDAVVEYMITTWPYDENDDNSGFPPNNISFMIVKNGVILEAGEPAPNAGGWYELGELCPDPRCEG